MFGGEGANGYAMEGRGLDKIDMLLFTVPGLENATRQRPIVPSTLIKVFPAACSTFLLALFFQAAIDHQNALLLVIVRNND